MSFWINLSRNLDSKTDQEVKWYLDTELNATKTIEKISNDFLETINRKKSKAFAKIVSLEEILENLNSGLTEFHKDISLQKATHADAIISFKETDKEFNDLILLKNNNNSKNS